MHETCFAVCSNPVFPSEIKQCIGNVKFIPKLSHFPLVATLLNKIQLEDGSERQSMVHFREKKEQGLYYTQMLPFWWSSASITAEVALLDHCTLPQMLFLKSPAKCHDSLDKAHTLHGCLASPARLSETPLLITLQPFQEIILTLACGSSGKPSIFLFLKPSILGSSNGGFLYITEVSSEPSSFKWDSLPLLKYGTYSSNPPFLLWLS